MNVYVVGGAVRDAAMGLEPKDFDYVVVGASPQDMLDLGYQQVGADFPVFLHPTTGDEYALARVERKVGNGYHGFEVSTEDVTLTDDLSRRDLTINAMARLVGSDTIIDPFGGMDDLEDGILRHVSPAFAEDPLRVIRLGRFYARYGFSIAPETLELAKEMVKNGDLNHLPHERFWAELTKVFSEKQPYRFFEFLHMIDATRYITFFEGLYGQADDRKKAQLTQAAVAVAMDNDEGLSADELMRIHTALKAIETSSIIKMSATDKTLRTMFSHVQEARRLERTADDVHKFMKSIKTWQAGDAFSNAVRVMWFNERIPASVIQQSKLKSGEILMAEQATHHVDSFMFIEIPPGKELGLAIDNERKRLIAKGLNLS